MKKRTELVNLSDKKSFVARTLVLLYINRVGTPASDNEDDLYPPLLATDFQKPFLKTIVDDLVSKRLVKIDGGNLVLRDKGQEAIDQIIQDGEKFQRVYGPFEGVQLGDYSFDCEFLLDAEDWDHYIELEEEYYANLNVEGYTGDDMRFAVANFRGVDVIPIGTMLKFHIDNVSYLSSSEVAEYLEGIDSLCYDIENTINVARRWEEMAGINIDDAEFATMTEQQLKDAEKAMTELVSRGLKLSKDLEEHRNYLLELFEEENGGEEYDDDDDDEFGDDDVVSRRTRRNGDEVVTTTTTTTYVDDPYYYDYGYGVYYDPWVPLLWCAILL